jgi:hypothetical protein
MLPDKVLPAMKKNQQKHHTKSLNIQRRLSRESERERERYICMRERKREREEERGKGRERVFSGVLYLALSENFSNALAKALRNALVLGPSAASDAITSEI